jgi:uncharacterized delta-60 repeat protein
MVVSGRRLALALTLFASMLWLVLVSVAHAAPGDLDTTFGSSGIVSSSTGTTESFGWAADVAVQSDGKIIAISTYVSNSDSQKEFLVERYNSNGTLDSSFGSGGIVKTSFGGTEAQASSVIIEPGGKILVGGAADGEFALARYNSNGTLDTSFGGGDGMSTSAVSVPEASGLWAESGSMALLPSGKIVLGGSTDIRAIGEDGEPYIAPHMVLARFNEDGTLDTSYGTNGIAAGPAGNLYGLTADSSDRILIAGWSNYEFAVARFTSSGSLDTSFAGTGLVRMDLSETGSKAAKVLVLPSGKILASGYGIGMTIFRFNEDGSLDSSFGGGDGTVTPSFSYPCCISSSAVALALDEDGRIVIVGDHNPEDENNPFLDEWAVARLYADGVPDKTFGTDGLTTNVFEGAATSDYASGVGLQSDGKIVAVGSAGYPHADLGLMRFVGGGSATEPSQHRLVITNDDPNEGRVRAPDMFCGYNCATEYEAGESIEIHAEGEYVQEGSEWKQLPFTGWTTISGNPGTCTGTTTPCEVMMNDDVDLKATFGGELPTQHTLTISKSGSGSGTVTSSPSGIDCGATCSHSFDEGTPIGLTATPVAGSTFAGWSGGGCSGTGACEVTLGGAQSVTASFALNSSEPPSSGNGSGGASSVPTPAPTAPAPTEKTISCRKGFKKKKVKGKVRCVKAKSHHSKGKKGR